MTRTGAREPVVVGVDDSDLSIVALAWAADEARRNARPLRIVHVARPGEQWSGRPILDAAEARAQKAIPDLDVSTSLETGHTTEGLLKPASDASVLVLGSRGRRGFSGLRLGSTSLHVAMHAPCPVVVIRTAGEDALSGPSAGRVVVGTDNSPGSQRALDFAFQEASSRGIGLTAVLASTGPEFDTSATPPREWEAAAQEQKAVLAGILGDYRAQHREVDVVEKAVWGHPPAVLIDESRGAELVVVGSHGRGGFGGMVLGSVSHALLHHAHCPVAVVRSPQ
jgi:nucleotide-binding universal stress UspA family protein